ncbi:peptidoglycan-binding domain-containing protein [Martelella radicis]|uniref:Peptidoglycan hydrolase-like protein with peptidoglycan-binding domain n=1 Tax=Martelella radicis TaxID=1397476 RepID=A0A7W6KI50_9HYPH|nr:peptidoglycan-binding domain-containing protein [Martelella radicis]MBB4121573.1 peptidoglycan hydrolase-like protein with peptidoglycan-binding domain [Martelella radicis]
MAKAKKTRRNKKKTPSLLGRGMSAVGGMIARHPSWLGGPLAFAVVLSFVSANALWYQPGPHPEPLMKTRQSSDPYAVPGRRMASEEDFETFRIELEEDRGGRSVEVASLDRDGGGDDLMAILETVQSEPPAVAPRPSPEPQAEEAVVSERDIIRQAQEQLAAAGYYKGKPDGVTGPLTEAAIRAFQADQGLADTGTADAGLLAMLKGGQGGLPPVPTPRADAAVPAASVDPVADLLASADKPQAADALVVEIQRGLVNIAYDDVTVDGVAGANTRAAILEFQKHYRLPETGEPSAAVRDKLKEIGAL